jgi:hypothetical protein
MSNISYTYDDGGRNASGFGTKEVRDCTVRAVALTSGVDYKVAHQILAKRGKRKNRRGAYLSRYIKEIQKDLPVTYRLIKKSGSIRSLIKEYGEGNRILCCMRGHAFAILNGTVHDMMEISGNCHVVNAWIVVPK